MKRHEAAAIGKNFLTFGAPLIEEEEIAGVVNSLRSGWIGTGPKVANFEAMFSQFIGSTCAVATSSCTAALHLAMIVSGFQPGDEIITTPMTFCATVNAIIHAGAKPVLVDCERETMNIDPNHVKDAINPRTRGIVPVHFAGRPCNMDAIMDIAEKNNLIVIEDAAHAIETMYKGLKIGTIGDLGCFSFYVTKNIVTGEGGMVTTNNQEFADRVKIMSLHGMTKDAWKRFSDEGYKHYQVVAPGFKYNMTDLQAAIGIPQLERVKQSLKRRVEVWQQYDNAFRELPIGLPPLPEPDTVHARHLYTLMIDRESCGITRDEFMQRLYELNIGTGVHYIGVHLHPYYRETFGYKPSDFPNATWISERTVSIPLSPRLTDADVNNVIEVVRSVLIA